MLTLARQAGVPIPSNSWDRHNYEAMMPGFGGSDSMDWRAFVDTLKEKGFTGAFEMENEANNSKGTGNWVPLSRASKPLYIFCRLCSGHWQKTGMSTTNK
jgi:hypothetical protein